MTKQFTFESRQKSVLFGFMALGILCMILTWMTDDELHTRFWTNYLHNSYMFAGVALMATFLLSAKAVAYSGWQTVFKRVWEAMGLNLGVGLVLMMVLAGGVAFGYHHLYHWTDKAAVAEDVILKGKSGFLNAGWYALGVLGFMFVWYLFALKIRSNSLAQDEMHDDKYEFYTKKIMRWGAAFLPIAGFTSAAFSWLVMMSLDAHWFSTMFAWYNGASWMVTMIATTILLLIYLKSKGYLEEVTVEHFHDLGKYLFGFSIFWTYLWFSQYMLIWYANFGEETTYFYTRLRENPVPFWANLVINFVMPFLILIRNDNKRKMGVMAFMSAMLIFGHWLDFFQMCKYGPLETAQHHIEHAAHKGDAHSSTTKEIHGTEVAAAAHAADAHASDAHASDAHAADAHAADAHAASATDTTVAAEKGAFVEHAEDVHGAPYDDKAEAAHGEAAHGEAAHAEAGHGEAAHGEAGHHAETPLVYGANAAIKYPVVPKAAPFKMGFSIPGLLELGTFLGFAALFVFFVFHHLAKAPLVTKNDPYLEESKHHHVI